MLPLSAGLEADCRVPVFQCESKFLILAHTAAAGAHRCLMVSTTFWRVGPWAPAGEAAAALPITAIASAG